MNINIIFHYVLSFCHLLLMVLGKFYALLILSEVMSYHWFYISATLASVTHDSLPFWQFLPSLSSTDTQTHPAAAPVCLSPGQSCPGWSMGPDPSQITATTTTILWLSGLCPGQLGWAGIRRIHHSYLSWSSIIPIHLLHLLSSMLSFLFNPHARQSLSTISPILTPQTWPRYPLDFHKFDEKVVNYWISSTPIDGPVWQQHPSFFPSVRGPVHLFDFLDFSVFRWTIGSLFRLGLWLFSLY